MPDTLAGPIQIAPIATLTDFNRCVDLQLEAWAMPDAADSVPAHLLMAVSDKGGVLLGAWVAQALVGFVFGFLGRSASGCLLHHSHMAAVLPAFRGRGIGYLLKLAQARVVLSQGLDLITWTYDPLEAGNAYFNLTRLGAMARAYHVNRYGELKDSLNRGLESDRFEVEWRLQDPTVQARLAGQVLPDASFPADLPCIAAHWQSGTPHPPPLPQAFPRHDLLIEIPANFQQIRQDNPDLALRWRLYFRRFCQMAFATGMAATALVREPGSERVFYQLASI